MEKNKYELEIDKLYFELYDFINPPWLFKQTKSYDNDLMYVHTTLNKISEQLGLFINKDEVKYHDLITLFILEAYQLLNKITPSIEPDIKCQLLSKAMQVFNIYTQLMDDKKARDRIQGIKGSELSRLKNSRAINILLPRIVAKHLTRNSDYMDHDFFRSIQITTGAQELLLPTDTIIRYLKANSTDIKIDKSIVNNKQELEVLIYAVYEEFFNETRRLDKIDNQTESSDYLDGNYAYSKFEVFKDKEKGIKKYRQFSDYKYEFNPERNVIFKKVKSIIKQVII